ncbi:hypothetical protein JVT61DRAFT_14274 [Boletus reticuloceps]|uniref:Uncharacterized protein n=1 Tax=Boletus reticuloceps TaxID=495285 RepID=A0A8I2YD19_9AGAM|nr:hypothetical protein JVT61DRAFT_14274 [Boletus reticuloceps]
MPPRRRYGALHVKLAGYEVCIHNCRCAIHRTTPLWSREGGSCARHSATRPLHPDCTEDCPGFSAFDVGVPRSQRTRNPTREDILEYLPPTKAALELRRLGLESESDTSEEHTAIPPISDDISMEVDEAESEQVNEEGEDECEHELDGDREDHPEDDMQIDADTQESVESTQDAIPRVVAGPSVIQSSSRGSSYPSTSHSTTSFGIHDPWRVTSDVAPSSVHRAAARSTAVMHGIPPCHQRPGDLIYSIFPIRAVR